MADQALQAAGNIIGGVGAYESGKYNRAVSRTMATEEERAGAADEARIRDAARMAIGDQITAQGANGFQQGTGSALDALAQSQVNAAYDALLTRQDAARRARAQRIQGDIAYAQGSNALVQGMMGAASTAVDWASARRQASAGMSNTMTASNIARSVNASIDRVNQRYGGGYNGDGTMSFGGR